MPLKMICGFSSSKRSSVGTRGVYSLEHSQCAAYDRHRYRCPVALGDHRLMLRPRDSHDLRLIQTNLNLSPPATLRWSHDVFGNSIAIASFAEPSAELRIESSLQLETGLPDHSGGSELSLHLFSADDRIDLGRMLERHHPDPADRL
jgi:transglutaminase superfamily protein